MAKPTLREALTQLLNGEVAFIRLPEVLNYTEISMGRLDTCRVIIADPIPQTEEVEVVRYGIVTDVTMLSECFYEMRTAIEFVNAHPGTQSVKLTGTYTRTVKSKVKHRLCGGKNFRTEDKSGRVIMNAPMDADLYAEWLEDAP